MKGSRLAERERAFGARVAARLTPALTLAPTVLAVVVLVVTALSMLLGVAMHHTCLGFAAGPPIGSGMCVSDVSALYRLRDLGDHVFPYGAPGAFSLPEGTVEYPVLTGLVAWGTAWPAALVPSASGYYLVTALVLTLVALAVSSLLVRLTGARALLFAASPLLVLYATQNWDLFPVAVTVGGVLAWSRRRDGLASVMFAIGACFKVFPLLFLIPLYADVRARKGRPAALRAVAPGIATGVLVNVPFMLRDLQGWWQPFSFQQARPVDSSALSVWSLFLQTTNLPLVNALATFLLLIGAAVICFFGTRRLERDGAYPFVQVCGALVVMWLLTAKASSPQFALWVLPFFALLRVPFWSWLALNASVVWVHVAFYAWIDEAFRASAAGVAAPEAHLEGPVLARMAVFALVIVVFLRSSSAVERVPVTYGRAHADPDHDLAPASAGAPRDGDGARARDDLGDFARPRVDHGRARLGVLVGRH